MKSLFSSAIAADPELIDIIFEALPEPTFLINRQGVYVEAWGGTDTKRHHDPKQIIGLSQNQVLPEKRARLHLKIIAEVLDSGIPKEIEYSLDPKEMPVFKNSGSGPIERQYFSGLVVPVKGVDLVLWLVRNITEYKRTVAKLASHKSKLEHLTHLDHLTQMYNRYAMDTLLPRALEQAKLQRVSAAIFMIDIDHFKDYNDHFGHQVGDIVLRKVSKALDDWKRKSDLCFRYGGDEFLIFITDIDYENCISKAQSLADKVAGLRIRNPTSSNSEHVTITVGLKHYPAIPSEMTLNQFVNIADKALMYGKLHQRGMVHVLD